MSAAADGWTIAEGRGDLWFKDRSGNGLLRHDGEIFATFTTEDGLPSDNVGSILVDRQGHLLFGARSVSRYDGATFETIISEDRMPHGWLRAMLQDRHGHLWMGMSDGLARYDGKEIENFSSEDGLARAMINTLLQDRSGNFWIGTWGGGISRYDGLLFQTLSTRDGLVHDAVWDIHQDRNGDIWIATEGGVSRYRPQHTPPEVRIKDIVADRRYGPRQELRIPDSQDFLVFEFRGRSLSTPRDGMVYVFQLEGYDQELRWTRDDEVEYTNLPIGDYTFQVQAVGRDLNYSEPASVAVVVTPAYGRTALMSALGISLLGLVVAGRYGLRRRRERDVARTDLVRERRQRIEPQPHEIDRWTIDDFIGHSAAMASVVSRVRDLQQQDSRTLLVGEAGTGKELVARAIHAGSQRSGQPFVLVRCAGLPKDMASLHQRTETMSLLFGHVEGSFADATEDRRGLVQQADGGTLFFDEVGLLPLPLQTHLMRILTERQVRRMGASDGEPLDVRAMAASSEDLEMQVQVGGFNRELYDYLAVQEVAVPPLRERREDMAPLAQQIADDLAKQLDLEPAPVSDEVVTLLQGYDFPGNVRQLRRILEQAMRLSNGPITPGSVNLRA